MLFFAVRIVEQDFHKPDCNFTRPHMVTRVLQDPDRSSRSRPSGEEMVTQVFFLLRGNLESGNVGTLSFFPFSNLLTLLLCQYFYSFPALPLSRSPIYRHICAFPTLPLSHFAAFPLFPL